MEIRTKENFLEALSETFLAPVLEEYLANNNFDPLNLSPVGENEIQVGELTDLEKVIFIVLQARDEEHCDLVEAMPESEEKEELLMLNSYFLNSLEDFFWANLRMRIGGQAYSGILEIREGFKVSLIQGDEEEESEFFGMGVTVHLELFETMFVNEAVGGCAVCPDYFECSLPIKEPRGKIQVKVPKDFKFGSGRRIVVG